MSIYVNIGELVVSPKPTVIETILGSCVSVCLYTKSGAGGLIHYSLPETHQKFNDIQDALKYGNYAVPLLIEQLAEVTGEQPSQFSAKIVGGSSGLVDTKNLIGTENVQIAEKYLKKFGINIVSRDVGGNLGRKIKFHTGNGRLQVAYLTEKIKEVIAPNTNWTSPQPAPIKKTDAKRRVLIVDDSSTICTLLTKILSEDPHLEVVGSAPNPVIAEKMIQELKPDVITLDIHMPVMDGVTFLENYMRKSSLPVVMITSISLEEGGKVLKALEYGAVDYIQKPTMNELKTLAPIIREKVLNASYAKVRINKTGFTKISLGSGEIDPHMILAIGASTGGTEAIKDVLTQLPKNIPPTVIVQHIPPVFSKAFADRLNTLCPFEVKEAQNGDELKPERVLIAPGGKQMKILSRGSGYIVEVNDDPPLNRHAPSVDYLFNSVADVVGKKSVGVILTGMGADGAKGLLKMKQKGSKTIAQDELSCVVFGMPREAIKIGAADIIAPLSEVSKNIVNNLTKRKAVA